ncbi:PBP1A family penicillin-binding protein [Cohnella sp. GCM10012308]|uniref:transglycosylase domain-containing protein n=1 Tax=Cohnella sp. GCM10012308 TaxID=3317329 RepID=UPI00361DB66B
MAQSAPKSSRSGKGGKPPRKRGRGKVALIWIICLAVLAVLAAAVAYLLVILNGERVLSANLNKLDLDRSTIVADANGNQIAKISIAGGNREYVQYKDIPKAVADAFVAVEDKRFYEHGGVDLFGIGRALAKDVVARSMVEGASTITQQLARNLFLNADKTWFRKGTEASIALALERHKTKEEILELYLNRIYFGNGQYGIKTAAKFYFGVGDLDQLKTWQIATLAAIPKGPSIYNPYKHPDNSMERRGVVLRLMTDQGLITEEERAAAAEIVYKPTMAMTSTSKFASFTDYAIDEALQKLNLTEEELLAGGYTIYTTIDTDAQSAMESEFSKDANFEKSEDDTPIQGAMVIMDQHDGSLKAMVGGRDYQKSGLNRVESRRQPGSSFKPIVSYGPALETGNYTPDSTLRDDKTCYGNGTYCPTDSNAKKYIGAVSMKEAIRESRNQPAVWLLNEIGLSTGVKFAGKLGIELGDEDKHNLAIALGGLTNGVTPVQMARAYGAFANGGQLQDAHAILKINDASGKTVYSFKTPGDNQVIKPLTAYYVTEIMKGVVSGGTGTKAQISGRTVAGKTGTTQLGLKGVSSSGNRDVWFVGFTPEYTAAVWMGYDKTDKDHYVKKSSGQAAALFSKIMTKALEGKKKQSFPVPDQAQEQPTPTPTADQSITDLTGVYDSQQVSVTLNWTAVPGDDITYKIYRKGSDESQFKLLVESVTPTADDLSILPDLTYTYYVKPYDPNADAEGAESNRVTVEVTSELEPTPTPTPSETPGEPTESLPPESTDVPDDGNGGDQGGQTPDGGQPTDTSPPSQTTTPSPTPSSTPQSTESTGPVARATATPSVLPTQTDAADQKGKKNDKNNKNNKNQPNSEVAADSTETVAP